MRTLLLLTCALTLLTSCYRMPGDQDYCVIPAVNNPELKNMQSQEFTPNVGY